MQGLVLVTGLCFAIAENAKHIINMLNIIFISQKIIFGLFFCMNLLLYRKILTAQLYSRRLKGGNAPKKRKKWQISLKLNRYSYNNNKKALIITTGI